MAESPSKVTSPAATGGAGNVFEQHVGALFLAHLLVRGVPPVLIECQLVEVHFQTNHLGWHVDDILLVGIDGVGTRRHLAAQVKRSFTVSSNDDDCVEAITDFWKDFDAAQPFSRANDALALVVLRGTQSLLGHLNSLLDCARAALDAPDFAHRLHTKGYVHATAVKYAEEIRAIVDKAHGQAVSDDALWSFLKCLHVLSYDLGTATGNTTAQVRTLLASTTAEPNPITVAEATWASLVERAGVWISTATSVTRDLLPGDLKRRHTPIEAREHRALQVLRDHSATILDGIRGEIGGTLTIERGELATSVREKLESNAVLIVCGPAGYGKSAIAKSVLIGMAKAHFAFAFRAEEFAVVHLDEALHKAQVGMSAEALYSFLSAQARKVLLIESVERLLEASTRDAFVDLLRLVKRDGTWRVLLTCRDYSVELVRTALLEHAGVQHEVATVPPLSDAELDFVASKMPALSRPIANSRLRTLLRNPYVLDKAAAMTWPDSQSLPQDEASFRHKFWRDVVREDHRTQDGLPQRRATVFTELALRRARSLSLFAQCGDLDQSALTRLRGQGLVVFSPDTDKLAAPAHDVLEDWAIIQWLHERCAIHERRPTPLEKDLGGFPAIRRAYRKWLGEELERDAAAGDSLALSTLQEPSLPGYFRDDTAVAALLSPHSDVFLQRHSALLLADDGALLRRIIHLLRVACRAAPAWFPSKSLPATMFVPTGTGWPPILAIAASALGKLLPKHAGLLVGLIEDWSGNVAWWSPYPSGSQDAATIAFGVLSVLDSYGHDELRKRTLHVIAKIPKGNAKAFLALLERARTRDRRDRAADDFAGILLEGMNGAFACREFPAEMITLAEGLFCLAEADIVQMRRHGFGGSRDIEPCFGVREHLNHDFFPSSAIRGPFAPLLRWHPDQGVDFIIRLLNHSATWYSEQKWPGFNLEPTFDVQIDLPERGAVAQVANGRFWAIYRGASVAPYVLQTALMALEHWLLEMGRNKSAHLEAWLLKCLVESNNVGVTSVVVSVSTAHPELAGKAGVAVITCRDFFEMDRWRMVNESHSSKLGMFPSLGVEKDLYENERRESAKLAHRQHDLVVLALKLQLGEHRQLVWDVLDGYKAALPNVDQQSEQDRLWRLVLHRMDLRSFKPVDPPEGAQAPAAGVGEKSAPSDGGQPKGVYFAPGPPDADLQQMLDALVPGQQRQEQDLGLMNWGVSVWRREGNGDPTVWRDKLGLAQKRSESKEEASEFARGGPGFVACVCVRDHWSELDANECAWCVNQIVAEIARDCDTSDLLHRVSKFSLDPSRPGAYVLALIVKELGPEHYGGIVGEALARALTHATQEVVDYAVEGVSDYLTGDRMEIALNCVAALGMKSRLLADLHAVEDQKPYGERKEHDELERSVVPAVRRAIVQGGLDAQTEVLGLDLDTWTGRSVGKSILIILGRCPAAELALNVHELTARALVDWWERDRRHGGDRDRRDYEFEHEASRRIAAFALKCSSERAMRICAHFYGAVEQDGRDVAEFISNLVSAEDRMTGVSPFWALWQQFADAVATSKWAARLPSDDDAHEPELLRAVFLGVPWKEGIQHWNRLDGAANRLDELFRRLPMSPVVLQGYSRFLYTVGGHSLPGAFVVVANQLRTNGIGDHLFTGDATFYLEAILRRFVYGEPHRVKSDPPVREAVLYILDALVESGSSAAYKMRDDCVTPLSVG